MVAGDDNRDLEPETELPRKALARLADRREAVALPQALEGAEDLGGVPASEV
jgi:hypothetical protein